MLCWVLLWWVCCFGAGFGFCFGVVWIACVCCGVSLGRLLFVRGFCVLVFYVYPCNTCLANLFGLDLTQLLGGFGFFALRCVGLGFGWFWVWGCWYFCACRYGWYSWSLEFGLLGLFSWFGFYA